MALETLAATKNIDGFAVLHTDEQNSQAVGPTDYVVIDHSANQILFKIQNGPILENGVNGCQVDTIIETALLIIRGLNQKFPCRENSLTITKLEEALHWSRARKKDRIERGVEGKNKE